MKRKLTYKIQLLTYNGENSTSRCKVWFMSDPLECMHDAREWVHWLACQLSSSFAYRILEFTQDSGDYFNYVYEFPVYVQHPIECIHWPPQPLTLSIKKKRLQERHALGFFYEYPERSHGVYSTNLLRGPKF